MAPSIPIACARGSIDPARHGKVFLHLYPFGGLARTARWARDFSAGIAAR